jgi:RNA polymerase sigma-70 factor (ECF subfamily)
LHDRELAERFLTRRDEEAFRQLFRRHSPVMFAIALRLSAGHRADAEDLVQDAWLRASRRLPKFEWRSALATWLCAIVINCARERMRARTLQTSGDAEAAARVAAPGASPWTSIDLERTIASLADGYREVLELYEIEGLTHAEIAESRGVAVSTSKSQLSRARALIRAKLKGLDP